MKKRIKRIISMFIVTVMLISMFSVNVMATGTEGDVQGDNTVSGSDAGAGMYAPVDTYVLDFNKEYTGHSYQYYSPYRFTKQLANIDTDGLKENITLVYTLYNTQTSEVYPAFCIDNRFDAVQKTKYQRLNLEEASYFGGDAAAKEAKAAKVRSIIWNGYPNTPLTDIQRAIQEPELTVAEIISAMQIALYRTIHGDAFVMHDYYSSFYKCNDKAIAAIRFYEDCTPTVSGSDAAAATATETRIKKASDYFVNLPSMNAQNQLLNAATFEDYTRIPVLTTNNDGTFNITVEAKVSVSKKEQDNLTLSAVMGDGKHYTQAILKDGLNEVELTINNVPAELAYTEIKLAIDGTQTADPDVFLFTAQGGETVSQSFAAIDSSQLPVHAEVTVIPPMEIELIKTAKIKERGSDGQVTEKTAPLAGISFDVYKQEGENRTFVTTLITDKDGNAYCNLGQSAGTFQVVEQSHPAIASPAAPIEVTLPYDNNGVKVYRAKIAVDNTIKEDIYVEPEVRKDVTRIDNNLDSYAIGEIHPWIIRGDIPVDIAVGKKYVISDTLDYRLSFDGEANVSVAVGLRSDTTGESNVFLNVGEQIDYTVAVTNSTIDVSGSDAEPITSFEVELTSVGMNTVANIVTDKIAKARAGTFSDYEIRVYFNAVIDEDAVPGVMIPNQAVLNYTNYVDYDFTTYSDIPQVYTCSLNIYKHDVENHDLPLNGATFKLARLATEAEINEGKAAPLVINDVTTYVVYETFYDKPISTSAEYNAKVQKVTTGAYGTNGAAVFYGIKEGDYYLVETKAPAGYNLMTEPIAVSVRLATMDLDPINVPNSSNFELPETGGIGTLIFTVGGAILIGAAILILLLNKKKQDKEDEEE